MQEFIQQAMQSLGISEETASSATGGALKLLEQRVSGTDFDQLLSKLPGAAALLQQAPAGLAGGAAAAAGGASGGGGMLGGMLGKAATALGGSAGSALGAAALLKQVGLDTDKAGPFLSLLVSFIRSKAGNDLAGRLLGGVPELAKLLDG